MLKRGKDPQHGHQRQANSPGLKPRHIEPEEKTRATALAIKSLATPLQV